MEEVGRFVEIASIKNNELELEHETLTKLFDGPDTRNTQIAIFSVLGPVRSKNSKLLGQMLLHLLEDDDDTELDDTTTEQILTFGNDEASNYPCVVTWSTPFFITKGARQKVSIFLLDIKGDFKDFGDKHYMALSGFCTFISSSTLYIANGNFEDSSIKHVESIALEAVRHFGINLSTILQNLRVIIENWYSPDEYNYGDKDGNNFARQLETSKKMPLFGAFDKFDFFLLPDENHGKYLHYFEKLLTTTLDSIYIVPKRLGGFIKSPTIISELKRYVDAMDPDDDFNGSLIDFIPSKNSDQHTEKLAQTTVSVLKKDTSSDTPKPKNRKVRKSSSATTHDSAALKERRKDLRNPYSTNNEAQKAISLTAVKTLQESANLDIIEKNSLIEDKKDAIQETNLLTYFKNDLEQPIDNCTVIDIEEPFDLSTFMESKNTQAATEEYKEKKVSSPEPMLTPLQILERITTKFSVETSGTIIHSGAETISTVSPTTGLIENNLSATSQLSEGIEPQEILKMSEGNSYRQISQSSDDSNPKISQLSEQKSTQQISQLIERNPTPQMSHFIERNPTPQMSHLIERNPTPQMSHLIERNSTKQISQLIEKNSIPETPKSIERVVPRQISQVSKRNFERKSPTTDISLTETGGVSKLSCSENKFKKNIVEYSSKTNATTQIKSNGSTMLSKNPIPDVLSLEKKSKLATSSRLGPETIKMNGYLRNQIELQIVNAFNNVSVQSTTSVDDILLTVKTALKKNPQDSTEMVECERDSVTRAIKVVLVYIQGMENAFKESLSFSPSDLRIHNDLCYKRAMSSYNSSNYLKGSVEMKIREAERLFHTHNQNYYKHYQTFVTNALQSVKANYIEKMKSNENGLIDEDLYRKKHEEVFGNIMRASKMSCDINKSPWSSNFLLTLERELKKEFEQEKTLLEKLKISKEKISHAVGCSAQYYKNGMIRSLRSEGIMQMSQFNVLHEKEYQGAFQRYRISTDKLPKDIILDGENQLKLQLEEHAKILRDDFIQNTTVVQSQKLHSTNHEVITPYFPQNISVIQNTNSFPNRCLAIQLDCSRIVASYLFKNEPVEIYRKKDPHIGYNGKIFLQEGKSLLQNFSDYSLGYASRNLVNLKNIFQNQVGDSISVYWDGPKEFRAEELLAFFLSQIKIDCEGILKGTISICTIVVPSYFHVVEVQAVRDAAVIAGYDNIQILREICAATIGTWFFTAEEKIPRQFIMINTYGEKWDAGYYNLNNSFGPNMLSGDAYANKRIWNGLSLQSRFKNIIDVIIKQVANSKKINIVIAGNESIYSELTTNLSYGGTKFAFFRVDDTFINSGAAFISALIGNDPNAQQIWESCHPVSALQTRYDFNTILNNPWTAPMNIQKSGHHKKGTNLDPVQLTEVRRKLGVYLTTPETVFADAKSFLLNIGKLISDESFDFRSREYIRKLINNTFMLIQHKGSQEEIQTSMNAVSRAYENTKCRTAY